MTNKLKPILIPTEDASIIYLQYDLLRIGKHIVKSKGKESNQHIYLVSDEPIKDGDWVAGAVVYKIKDKQQLEDANAFKHFKIILTTDFKLIADGVPAIDGNTKAEIKNPEHYNFKVSGVNYQNKHRIEVNFLTELCKRWNDKADIVIEVEMEEHKHYPYPTTRGGYISIYKIKLDSNGQPTLIFK